MARRYRCNTRFTTSSTPGCYNIPMVEQSNAPTDTRPHSIPARLRHYADRLQDSFPMAVAKRFVEIDVLTQAASVSFYALLSLAPLLVMLRWLTASLDPPAQQDQVDQSSSKAGKRTLAQTSSVSAPSFTKW